MRPFVVFRWLRWVFVGQASMPMQPVFAPPPLTTPNLAAVYLDIAFLGNTCHTSGIPPATKVSGAADTVNKKL